LLGLRDKSLADVIGPLGETNGANGVQWRKALRVVLGPAKVNPPLGGWRLSCAALTAKNDNGGAQ
jgi:hypothetical protein